MGLCSCGRALPKPVVLLHIFTVALAIRSNASRQASAGGHLSMRSVSTEVAARIVKSTSSKSYSTVSLPLIQNGLAIFL